MHELSGTIRINRAPVLTLWAEVVAERLAFDRDTALTLGQTVAGCRHPLRARTPPARYPLHADSKGAALVQLVGPGDSSATQKPAQAGPGPVARKVQTTVAGP